nr:hypothetical protein [Tanacetum cinerariifolium]
MINIYDDSCVDYLEYLFATNHLSGNPTFYSHIDLTSPEVKDDIFDPEGDIVLDSTKDLPPPHNINPLSGITTSSSPNHLLEEFADELALITFPLGNDDLPFDIEFDLREIEYLLNHDPTKKISSDFLPSPEYDSFLFEDFSKVDALPSTNNEDMVFNLGILIQENLSESNVQATPDKNVKKIAISYASLILDDFDPPLYELPFHKEVPSTSTVTSQMTNPVALVAFRSTLTIMFGCKFDYVLHGLWLRCHYTFVNHIGQSTNIPEIENHFPFDTSSINSQASVRFSIHASLENDSASEEFSTSIFDAAVGELCADYHFTVADSCLKTLPCEVPISNALNPADQDSLNSATGGNLLERRTQDVLTIIENKYKQTSAMTTAMTAILKQFQATPPSAFIKFGEEIYVTCGGAHPFYLCLAADGNTFSEFQDNIQGCVLAAAINYNQGSSGYRPLGVANPIRPPGFA